MQWDCVFLDALTPYISVRRAWRNDHNRADISTSEKSVAVFKEIIIYCNIKLRNDVSEFFAFNKRLKIINIKSLQLKQS